MRGSNNHIIQKIMGAYLRFVCIALFYSGTVSYLYSFSWGVKSDTALKASLSISGLFTLCHLINIKSPLRVFIGCAIPATIGYGFNRLLPGHSSIATDWAAFGLTAVSILLTVTAKWKRSIEVSLGEIDRLDSLGNVEKGNRFEDILCALFRSLGHEAHTVRELKSSGKFKIDGFDNGGDVVVTLRSNDKGGGNGQRILVQAKHYSGAVSNSAVQEAVAAVKFFNCDRASVVTQSRRGFTKAAVQLASANGVNLVGRAELAALIEKSKKSA